MIRSKRKFKERHKKIKLYIKRSILVKKARKIKNFEPKIEISVKNRSNRMRKKNNCNNRNDEQGNKEIVVNKVFVEKEVKDVESNSHKKRNRLNKKSKSKLQKPIKEPKPEPGIPVENIQSIMSKKNNCNNRNVGHGNKKLEVKKSHVEKTFGKK